MKTARSYYTPSVPLIAILLLLQVSDYHLLFAQRFLTTFGRISNIKTSIQAAHLVTGDFNGDHASDLALVGGNKILIKYSDTSGWRSNVLTLDRPILAAVAVRVNRDKRDDLVVVLSDPFEVRSYLATSSERFMPVWRHRLDNQFENIIVGDINNDGIQDILLFGKKQLGITLFPGTSGGLFRKDTTILTDYSFSALLVENINNDGINDLMGTNWISNDVMIMRGFGKLKFSEPHLLHGDSEPRFFNAAIIDADEIPDLVVVYPEEHLFKTFHGNGFGDYQLSHTNMLPSEPTSLDIADINMDGHADLGILTVRSLLVELNDGKGMFDEEVEFSAGEHPLECSLFSDHVSHQVSAAVLDSINATVRYFYSSHADIPSRDDDFYATGLAPGGILPIDIRHNLRNDLLVPCTDSRTISLFLNRGDDTYSGQIVFGTTIPIQHLRIVGTSDTTVTFIGNSSAAESVAIIGITTTDYSHHVLTLPTQGRTDILFVRQDTVANRLHIFALEHGGADTAGQLIEYEQMTPTRFIERTYRSLTRDPIVAAAITTFDSDKYPDLIYGVYNKKRRVFNIDLARGTAAEQYGFSRVLDSLSLPELSSANLWYDDLNGDRIPDIILNIGEPVNTLYTFLGKKDSTFSLPKMQFSGEMSILEKDDLQLIGKARDRRESVLINNHHTRMLQIYHVREDGLLVPASRLLSTEGIHGFLLCRNPQTQTNQIVVSDRRHGYLRVISVDTIH